MGGVPETQANNYELLISFDLRLLNIPKFRARRMDSISILACPVSCILSSIIFVCFLLRAISLRSGSIFVSQSRISFLAFMISCAASSFLATQLAFSLTSSSGGSENEIHRNRNCLCKMVLERGNIKPSPFLVSAYSSASLFSFRRRSVALAESRSARSTLSLAAVSCFSSGSHFIQATLCLYLAFSQASLASLLARLRILSVGDPGDLRGDLIVDFVGVVGKYSWRAGHALADVPG